MPNYKKQMKYITESIKSEELDSLFEFYPVTMDSFLKKQCNELDISEVSLPYAKWRLEKGLSEKKIIETSLQKLKSNKDKAIKKQLELIESKNRGEITAEFLQVERDKITKDLSIINNGIKDLEKRLDRNTDVIRVMSGYIEKQGKK